MCYISHIADLVLEKCYDYFFSETEYEMYKKDESEIKVVRVARGKSKRTGGNCDKSEGSCNGGEMETI